MSGQTYGWNGIANTYATGRAKVEYVFYDASKNFVAPRTPITSALKEGTMVIPEGVAFVRFSLWGNPTEHADADTFRFFAHIAGGGGSYTFTDGVTETGGTVTADMEFIEAKIDEDYGDLVDMTGTPRNNEIVVGASNTLATVKASGKKLTDLQDKLVSGTNIKTVNGETILGSGDIEIAGAATPTVTIDYTQFISETEVQLTDEQYEILTSNTFAKIDASAVGLGVFGVQCGTGFAGENTHKLLRQCGTALTLTTAIFMFLNLTTIKL